MKTISKFIVIELFNVTRANRSFANTANTVPMPKWKGVEIFVTQCVVSEFVIIRGHVWIVISFYRFMSTH